VNLTTILRAAALFAVWVVLSQNLDPFYLGLGFTTAVVVAWLNRARPTSAGMHWARLAMYLPWLLWQVLVSGAHVAYLILHPRMPIAPQLIRYRTSLRATGAVVTFGNSITLTPGTITAEVSPGELVIHSIDEAAAAGLQDMAQRVARVFGEAPGAGS
jgi:multicomponent Na+:H+ antiporter subunit E